jgi:hypothetical protein
VSSTFFDGTVSSAGGVTLQVSSFTVYSGRTFNLAGASAKVIESTSTENSFGASVNLTGLTVSSDSTSVRVGKSTNTAGVTLGNAWTVAGPLTVNAGSITQSTGAALSSSDDMWLGAASGDISLSANVSVTGSGKSATFKSSANVVLGAYSVQTNAGAITFWSDSDGETTANRGGGIRAVAGSTISSSGGAIMLSGGVANAANLGTSWAKGTTTTGEAGIWLSGTISSGAGALTIRGEEAAVTTSTKMGVLLDKTSNTSSTTGNINIDGKVDAANTNTADNHYGTNWLDLHQG